MLCVFTHLTVNRVINFKRGCKRQVDNSPTGTIRFISKTITALAAIYRHLPLSDDKRREKYIILYTE